MKYSMGIITAAALGAAFITASTASASLTFYINDPTGFATATAGNTLLGVETFEGNTSTGSLTQLVDPLTQGIANGPFLTGLVAPITIQGNVDGGSPASPNPLGAGLFLFDAGVLGAPTDQILASGAPDSLDIIFDATDQVGGVGFDVIIQDTPDPAVEVRVYDTSNVLLGMITIAGDAVGTNFLGIQSTGGDLIGRINVFSPNNQNEGGDNIQVFTAIPEPSTFAVWSLLSMTVAGARRRQRTS